MTGRGNLEWAAALIAELVRSGVEWFVVAPGSRSTPLVLAAHEHPDARTLVHLDERSAAFLALGIGKATGVPAAVITTSGTATANLLPAAVEASQSENPLILVTADRPTRLVGGDANQAITQRELYGRYAKASFDLGAVSTDPRDVAHLRQVGSRAVHAAQALPQGAVHINAPFAKPLEPATGDGDSPVEAGARSPRTAFLSPAEAPASSEAVQSLAAALAGAERPLIVAGPSATATTGGAAARLLASSWGVPLVADPLSGARFGPTSAQPHIADHADLFLSDASVMAGLEPDAVVRVGRSATSQRVMDLCVATSERGGPVVLLDVGGRWKDHRASVTHVATGDPEGTAKALLSALPKLPDLDAQWLPAWTGAAQAAKDVLGSLEGTAMFEGLLTRRAVGALPDGGVLFVSSSMPIRDVDAFIAADAFQGVALGNRGASGIDGITSTALGAAIATERPLLAVVGDVAFLHDLGGLLATRDLRSPVVFVVINNDGGGIFHLLPIRDHEPAFTRFFATPHGLDFRGAAAMFNLPYQHVTPDGLEAVVRDAFDEPGAHVIEVPSDRELNRTLRQAAAERVGQAARAAVREALQ